jgi:hypothetical protein
MIELEILIGNIAARLMHLRQQHQRGSNGSDNKHNNNCKYYNTSVSL